MPKHASYVRETKNKKDKMRVPPIWRGIGCILIIIIPLISYATALVLVENRSRLSWVIIPNDVIVSRFTDPFIFVKMIYAVIITLLLFLFLTIVTFTISKFLGPPRFGPFDVKPK